MTSQEIFTKAARHMLRQGQKSLSVKGTTAVCLYRGPNGLKCGVGAVIEDKDYKPEMESKGIYHDEMLGLLPYYLKPHRALLDLIQRVHDGWSPETWEKTLRSMAESEGLVFDLSLPSGSEISKSLIVAENVPADDDEEDDESEEFEDEDEEVTAS